MRSLFLILMTLCSISLLSAQSLEGSWQLTSLNDEEVADREVIKIVTDTYFALGSKRIDDNSFLGAAGGEYKLENNTLIEKRDFDTYDETKINQIKRYRLTWVDDDTIEISDSDHKKVWKKLSSETDELSGNWAITARQRGEAMMEMKPLDRRTIKILHANRFQWVAFNSSTKAFMGTGGGIYSANDGNYTEHITFFSKDKNRVGADLDFDFEVIDGKWHHKGKSSKGEPIYEVWSPYFKSYPNKVFGN